MLRFSVLLMGCLVFAGLTAIAAGPLRATATPPSPATPRPRSTAATATPQPTAVRTAAATAATVVTPATAIPTTVGVPAATAVAPPIEALDPPELRAVWVDAFHDGFKTPQQVDDLVAWARSANVNALFVQVRRRGDAYYLKSFEPRTDDPDLTPGFDALQYLLDKAHQGPRRLQVHAWLATLPIWGQRDTPPAAVSHAFNLRGPNA